MAKTDKKPGIVMNTVVLVIATLVCVALLATVNQITAEPIKEAEVAARAQSYAAVYPGAEKFSEPENTQEMLDKAPDMLASAGYEGCYINDVLAVNDASGNVAGYVIAATSPNGYGGEMQAAVGITKDGKLTGMGLVSHSETAGLGSKAGDPEFTDQFKGLNASKIEYYKSGANADNNEIDAISGATISTGAATEAVNAAIAFYQDNFAGGVQTEEKADPLELAFPGVDVSSLSAREVQQGDGENYTVNEVYEVEAQGYIITATAHNGYHGDIKIALGIGSDGIIKGYGVIEHGETRNLGDQCASEEFGAQFTGLKASQVKSVASGADKGNNEIDAIASATITTNAVLEAVNAAADYYNAELKGE